MVGPHSYLAVAISYKRISPIPTLSQRQLFPHVYNSLHFSTLLCSAKSPKECIQLFDFGHAVDAKDTTAMQGYVKECMAKLRGETGRKLGVEE